VIQIDVAVDSLLDSCVKMWHELDPNTPAPFARVYSAGQIKAQWSAGDLSTLEHPYHIDQLRHQLASQNREAYASYLRGREELKEHGNIADEEVHKAYSKQCKSMNKYILGTSVRVVFCTVASCQTPALYEEDPANGDLKWYFKATTIIVDEAGTIERPFLMMLCVAFPDSQRLVLAGDPFQLPAFKLSETTKTYWPKCYLEDVSSILPVFDLLHQQLPTNLIHLVSCDEQFLIYRRVANRFSPRSFAGSSLVSCSNDNTGCMTRCTSISWTASTKSRSCQNV